MTNNNNSTGNCSHPAAEVVVVDVNVDMESNEFAANIKQDAGSAHEMPSIAVGACIVVVANGVATHQGIANETSDPGNVSEFSAHLFPLLESCTLSNQKPDYVGSLPKLTLRHLVEVTTDGSSFWGCVRKLSKADANHLLTQIGPFAPSEMLDVFWTESGRAAIDAKFDAQQRYIDNANALFQTI